MTVLSVDAVLPADGAEKNPGVTTFGSAMTTLSAPPTALLSVALRGLARGRDLGAGHGGVGTPLGFPYFEQDCFMFLHDLHQRHHVKYLCSADVELQFWPHPKVLVV